MKIDIAKHWKWIACLAFGIWILAPMLVTGLAWLALKVISTPLGDLGQFGDLYGAINTLFSGLAFLGVLYSINLQQGEITRVIKLQQDETARSTREAAETAKHAEQTTRIAAVTAALNIMPNLLEAERNCLRNIEHEALAVQNPCWLKWGTLAETKLGVEFWQNQIGSYESGIYGHGINKGLPRKVHAAASILESRFAEQHRLLKIIYDEIK